MHANLALGLIVGAVGLVCSTQLALGAACNWPGQPSASSETPTRLLVFNDGAHPLIVYWADTRGNPVEKGAVAPGEHEWFDVMMWQNWYFEFVDGDKRFCAGPVYPYDYEPCEIHAWPDNGIALSYDFCQASE